MSVQYVHFRANPIEKIDAELAAQNASLEERVVAVLRQVYDPELPVNIYDLGLIYSIDINAHNDVH